jgi:hypothetical protein
MVVHDTPTRFRFSEEQSKKAVGLVTGSLQMPATENQRRVLAQNSDFEV